MATQTATRGGGNPKPVTPAAPAVAAPRRDFGDRALEWIKAHRQASSWIGTAIVLAAVLVVWQLSIRRRAEEIASQELQGARYAYENQNLPLAASELAKVVENYSGSNAASEARLLLANVRLLQGQPQQAIDVLKDYASGAGKAYRSQAYGLLGAAYENLGRWRDAAEAYENGATAARLDFQKAQMLSDAGRSWTTAADTAKAVADYRRIVKEFAKEGNVTEAKVRLAELTRGSI
ncbi:MAG TPA: tetratricopeptide repeat protein [Gemmatimonadales bacterium]